MPKVAARQPAASTPKAKAKELEKPKAKTPAKPAEVKAKGWTPKNTTVSAGGGGSEAGGGGGGSTRTVSGGGGGGEAGNGGVSPRQPSRPEPQTNYSSGGGGE